MKVDLDEKELVYLLACIETAFGEGGPYGLESKEKLSETELIDLFRKLGFPKEMI